MKVLKLIFILGSLLLVLLLTAGCAQDQTGQEGADETIEAPAGDGAEDEHVEEEDEHADNEEGTSPLEEAKEAASPKIRITSPADGETISGTKVDVEVSVDNLELVDKLGGENAEGEGHLHYILDEGAPVPSAATQLSLDVTPGKHSIKVEIHNNDHSPLDPPVEASATFTVQ